jgi:hypothetical protein
MSRTSWLARLTSDDIYTAVLQCAPRHHQTCALHASSLSPTAPGHGKTLPATHLPVRSCWSWTSCALFPAHHHCQGWRWRPCCPGPASDRCAALKLAWQCCVCSLHPGCGEPALCHDDCYHSDVKPADVKATLANVMCWCLAVRLRRSAPPPERCAPRSLLLTAGLPLHKLLSLEQTSGLRYSC